MSVVVERLKSELTKLPPADRADLAFFLIDSLDETEEPDAESAWEAEIVRRVNEIHGGRSCWQTSRAGFHRHASEILVKLVEFRPAQRSISTKRLRITRRNAPAWGVGFKPRLRRSSVESAVIPIEIQFLLAPAPEKAAYGGFPTMFVTWNSRIASGSSRLPIINANLAIGPANNQSDIRVESISVFDIFKSASARPART